MTELAGDVEATPAINQVFYGVTYPSPDTFFFPQYHSRAAGTWASMEWVLSDNVDAMIDAARATADVAEQNVIYKDLQRKFVEDEVGVFLPAQRSQLAFHNCLQNFTWLLMQSFEYNFHTMKWVCD